MRHFLSGMLALAGLAVLLPLHGCSEHGSEAGASPEVAEAVGASADAVATPAGLARADFDVAGMDCGGCVIGTRAVLRRLEGVERAEAAYDDATGEGTAWVLYDPAQVTPERMMEAIRELGYTPTPAEARS